MVGLYHKEVKKDNLLKTMLFLRHSESDPF